jgi:hypothetical protein
VALAHECGDGRSGIPELRNGGRAVVH